jgi:CDK-activating kinase assembly factor MAT1
MKDFDPLPLSTQRYTKEVKLRHRLNRIFVLERADFTSDSDWNDWEEWKADVIWDMTEGDREGAKEAERKVEEWRKVNQSRIDKAMERKREEDRRAQLKAEGKLDDTIIDGELMDNTYVTNINSGCSTCRASLVCCSVSHPVYVVSFVIVLCALIGL